MDSWSNNACGYSTNYKGIELGPANTNRDVLYEGPKKTTEERWKAFLNGWKREKLDQFEIEAKTFQVVRCLN